MVDIQLPFHNVVVYDKHPCLQSQVMVLDHKSLVAMHHTCYRGNTTVEERYRQRVIT